MTIHTTLTRGLSGPAKSAVTSPYLDTEGAAEYLLVVGKRTLERLRLVGGGPKYRKAGRRVLYARADLDAWLESRSFSSTAEGRRAGVV